MHRRITNAVAVLAAALALSSVALLPVAAAPAGNSTVAAVQGQAPPGAGTAPSSAPAATATPGGSSSPTGPADPGTGETKESKETRVDLAPYVVGAVLLVVVIGAVVLWRRRGNKTIV
jgi:cobalamin biosynthesis Mg chelatase CobN